MNGDVEQVIPARRRDLGGFEVGRVLPAGRRRMVGPFIFFDHIGPAALTPPVPRSMDVRPHPHIGLATVTYLFEGEMTHRDSLGFEQVIRPAEVNWMTAGRAIAHSERFDGMRERGGALHGIQAWVALPAAHEEVEPAFEHYARDRLPLIEDDGWSARVIAGELLGAQSAVRTHSPLLYAHIELAAGARLAVPDAASERAVFVAQGAVEVAGQACLPAQMLILGRGTTPTLVARAPSTLMLLGGEPVGPRYIWWNFVSSRRERIEQAKADWQAGRFALPVGDDREIIPAPNDPLPEPPPLS
ncbi:MAG TPA: pirin family protein [Burkholderiaceae bacterium]|nr:pirin family protein [Burkholderiaceae bacterium]